MDVKALLMIAVWVLCLPIFGEALLPISLWDGLVPSIIVEKDFDRYAEFTPAFHGAFDAPKLHARSAPSVVGRIVGSDALPLLKTYPHMEHMNEVLIPFRFRIPFRFHNRCC